LSERDPRLRRPRHSDARRKHVVAAPLDSPQGFEVHGAHDFGGDEAIAIFGRPYVDGTCVEVPRALAFKREEIANRSGRSTRREIVDRATVRRQILQRQIQAGISRRMLVSWSATPRYSA
jgi:hypothetical protein